MRSAPDAIVLCGGAGTRIRTVTDGPKAMMPVNGRPFLELILRQLKRWGTERVILATGYRADVIESYFGNEAFGLQLVYSPEVTPLGTGGALRNAADLVQSTDALVLNGDSYTDGDLRGLERQHQESNAEMTLLVVSPDGRDDTGTVSVDGSGRLLSFEEKRAVGGPRYINAGIYLLSRKLLMQIPAGRAVSLEREVIPQWLEQGRNIGVTIDRAACVDIGTPDRYETAQTVLATVEAGV
jgi:mannose-1-phosphate guanylyltransferase